MAFDVDLVKRATTVQETANRVIRRMAVDQTVSTDEVQHLARACGELAAVVAELARREWI